VLPFNRSPDRATSPSRSKPRAPLASPESQGVSFAELFFDLVFVFAVTQTVGVLHHGLTLATLGQAVLAFWLIWWAWTQFTWTLNAANTDHPGIVLAILGGTAIAFAMAVEVPNAFGPDAIWFAVPYVSVRLTGLWIYWVVAKERPGQRNAVTRFALASMMGLVAVIAGAVLGGPAQMLLWGLTILLDVIAATVSSNHESWGLRAGHFVERHGLIVIIALGESLIVAAGGMTGAGRAPELLGVGTLAVLITCALWLTYFPRLKPFLEHALESASGSESGNLARDAFSLWHFPMLCGIIGLAAGIERIIADPGGFQMETQLLLMGGVGLFLLGAGFSRWRAGGGWPIGRLVVVVVGTPVVLAAPPTPLVTMTLVFAGISVIAVLEHQREVAP
jgi:low temperature requirement protein LtrA